MRSAGIGTAAMRIGIGIEAGRAQRVIWEALIGAVGRLMLMHEVAAIVVVAAEG